MSIKFLGRIPALVFSWLAFCLIPTAPFAQINDFVWTEVNSSAPWEARAGLQAVELDNKFFVMGGRSPKATPLTFGDSVFHNDVWMSADQGITWTEVNPGAPWPARAYFQTVVKGEWMYVLGGQDSTAVPFPPFNDEPPCSSLETPLPEGVDCPEYILTSNFFNDVWRSQDGITWEQMNAPGAAVFSLGEDEPFYVITIPGSDSSKSSWSPRAGLSAVATDDALWVMGGSINDDIAIIGPGGPPRIYYNDVWRSDNDGRAWTQATGAAGWEPRAGAVAIEKDDQLFVLGGEDGFICPIILDIINETNFLIIAFVLVPQLEAQIASGDCPPYFNDVWSSADGVTWNEVTAAAGWPSRPGHQCEIINGEFVCFGGFRFPLEDFGPDFDPFAPANPMDIWTSPDGATWTELTGTASPPWNAAGPEDIKYDFAAFSVDGASPAIYTFGGDRETFDPEDTEAYLKVDNDVWKLQASPPP